MSSRTKQQASSCTNARQLRRQVLNMLTECVACVFVGIGRQLLNHEFCIDLQKHPLICISLKLLQLK